MSEIYSEIWCDQFIENIDTNIFEEEDDEAKQSLDKPSSQQSVVTEFILELKDQDHHLVNLEIESFKASTRDLVGLQLWRGAFLLAEYLLEHHELIEHKNVLELASGTGFTSLIAALYAKTIISTDIDHGNILQLLNSNFARNETKLRASFKVKELDFFKADSWKNSLDLQNIDVILAADVVYNSQITKAFFETLKYLLKSSSQKSITVFIALEKRLWTDSEGRITAPSYDLFTKYLQDQSFKTQELSLGFPHLFSQFYDRVNNLVLWEIKNA